MVALRKESVDRNFFDVSLNYKEVLSLSARRAWIEMIRRGDALKAIRSLSARRAWIEMQGPHPRRAGNRSLSARRAWIEMICKRIRQALPCRRSPQGERG